MNKNIEAFTMPIEEVHKELEREGIDPIGLGERGKRLVVRLILERRQEERLSQND